jgi:glutathione S-transferase
VWILLEEKKIPFQVKKINMRSYGDKPVDFLRLVPNGLLPAIQLDGVAQTDSLQIMLNLERTFSGPQHRKMWPAEGDADYARAGQLMRLERESFSAWCGLVFRPSFGGGSRKYFEEVLDEIDRELGLTEGPWFLSYLSIVDLTFITHVERMCASVAYWGGFKVRGEGRWPGIERWMDAFEAMPSYMATKSDYYTHIMDIPPQYGPGCTSPGWERLGRQIDGTETTHWRLPLPPFSARDVEPVSVAVDPGEEAARHEAAYSLLRNHKNVAKFALRGAGQKGNKQFSAPLADPYAVPDLDPLADMEACLRLVSWMWWWGGVGGAFLRGTPYLLLLIITHYYSLFTISPNRPPTPSQVAAALLSGHSNVPALAYEPARNAATSSKLAVSLEYLKDRVGVPRDMSYPAARQLRAHLNWVKEALLAP